MRIFQIWHVQGTTDSILLVKGQGRSTLLNSISWEPPPPGNPITFGTNAHFDRRTNKTHGQRSKAKLIVTSQNMFLAS